MFLGIPLALATRKIWPISDYNELFIWNQAGHPQPPLSSKLPEA